MPNNQSSKADFIRGELERMRSLVEIFREHNDCNHIVKVPFRILKH